MNAVADFLSTYSAKETTKEAAFNARGLAGAFGSAAGHGLAAAGAASVVAGTGLAASKVYDAFTKGRDFKQMLEFNPDLHEHLERNPKMFNQMFTTLRSMNSTYGSDPLVSGTYMRNMIEANGNAGGVAAATHVPTNRKLRDDLTAIGGQAAAGFFAERNKFRGRMAADPLTAFKQEHERAEMAHAVGARAHDTREWAHKDLTRADQRAMYEDNAYFRPDEVDLRQQENVVRKERAEDEVAHRNLRNQAQRADWSNRIGRQSP